MANEQNLKPFVKGDARINRYGRPKSFDILRKLAQRIAAEPIAEKNGYTVTRIEAMLLAMSSSKHPSDRKTFLEYAYGKVKDEIELGVEIKTNLSPEQIAQKVASLLVLAQERKDKADANNA